MQIDLLMRVLTVIMPRHVAGDHHHRDRVQRRVGNARTRVGQAGTQMRKDYRRLLGSARVTIGHMRGDLFVACVDEADFLALLEGRQYRDIGVAAQPEDMFYATRLKITYQLMGYQIFHRLLLQ